MKLNRDTISEKARDLYSEETMCKNYFREYDKNGRKNRILLIDVNCSGSSTGDITYSLYKKLLEDGRDASICYGRGPTVDDDKIYKFGIDLETILHAGLSRITGYNGCFSPVSTHRLINYIDKFKPDLIHIHELHAYFVNLKGLLTYIKQKSIPVVWTFHCEYMYTGKCGYAFSCSNYQRDCGNCPSLHDYPKSLFFDRTQSMLKEKKQLLGDYDFSIITPSKWSADRVKLSFLKSKSITVVHNGVNTEIYHPTDANDLRKRLSIPADYKVVLFVAPDITNTRKGGYFVVDIANRMLNEKIVFVLVGKGTPPEGSPPNTIFVGPIKNKNELATYYSMADVFLLCSEKETYSMTCAEALCCGTPVVGFKCGAPETVFNEPFASFVEYGNTERIIAKLKTFII